MNKSTEGHQKSKRGTKTTSHFRGTKNTRPRKCFARLADSNDEPMQVQKLQTENNGLHIKYRNQRNLQINIIPLINPSFLS